MENEYRLTALLEIERALLEARPSLSQSEVKRRAETVLQDLVLLARCARGRCLITYSNAIALRGHGNPQSGQWLDEVFAYAIKPLDFPDLTVLVVNKSTSQPSPEAFNARRIGLSSLRMEDVPDEQLRCVWFQGYEEILGELASIPKDLQHVRILKPEPIWEREISRAVSNAIARARDEGKMKKSVGKPYPRSLSRPELTMYTAQLLEQQNGRCALTGQPFEQRSDEEDGIQDDRISLDRIDNAIGYAEGNIQLVTQFANRARGTLSIEEVRKRLVQYEDATGATN